MSASRTHERNNEQILSIKRSREHKTEQKRVSFQDEIIKTECHSTALTTNNIVAINAANGIKNDYFSLSSTALISKQPKDQEDKKPNQKMHSMQFKLKTSVVISHQTEQLHW